MKPIYLLSSFLIITIVPLCGMEKKTNVISFFKKTTEIQSKLEKFPKEIQDKINHKRQTLCLSEQKKNTILIYPNFDCSLFCNNNNGTKQLNIWIAILENKNPPKLKSWYIEHNTIIKKELLQDIWKEYYRKRFSFGKKLPHDNARKPFFFLTNKNYHLLVKKRKGRYNVTINSIANYIIFLKNNQQNIKNYTYTTENFPLLCETDKTPQNYFINSVSTSINGNLNLLSITQEKNNSPVNYYLRVWEFCSNNIKCELPQHQHLSNKNEKPPRLISQCDNNKQTPTPITNILCLTDKVFIGIKNGGICIISVIPQENYLSIFLPNFQPYIQKITHGCLHPSNYLIELNTHKLPNGFKAKQIAVNPNCRKELLFVATKTNDNKEHTNLYHIFLDKLLMKNGNYMFKKITELESGVPDFLGFEGDDAIVAYTKRENNTISVVTNTFCLVERWVEIVNKITIQRNKNLFAQCLKEIVKH